MLLRGYRFTDVIYILPILLISLAVHEFFHAYVSFRLGDPTARNQGRLTINPMKHVDWLGAIMFLLVGVGWAKPVPVNPIYYRDRRKGILLTTFAGPLSNVALAFIFAIPMFIIGVLDGLNPDSIFSISVIYHINKLTFNTIIFYICRFFYITNIILAVFNLLPIPPLDGYKLLTVILPPRKYYNLQRYENFITIGVLILIFILPRILFTIMSPFFWCLETSVKLIVKSAFSIFL